MNTRESVKLVIANPHGDFLLLRRVFTLNGRPEIRGGAWDLPGGQFEPTDNNDVLLAAERELKQEAGLDLGILDIKAIKGPFENQSKYGHTNLRHLVIARCALNNPEITFDNQPGTEPEHSESQWASPMYAYHIIDHPVQQEFIKIASLAVHSSAELFERATV